MMLIDSRKLWEDGGYSKDHGFDVSMNRVRKYSNDKNCRDLELILAEFFIELSKYPAIHFREAEEREVVADIGPGGVFVKYHPCDCGCTIGNSGTNAIHTIFKRIDEAVKKETKTENDIFTEKLNKLIVAHMESDNKKYTDKNGPSKYKWHDMPTFKKMVKKSTYKKMFRIK